jgi:hypothetical protein
MREGGSATDVRTVQTQVAGSTSQVPNAVPVSLDVPPETTTRLRAPSNANDACSRSSGPPLHVREVQCAPSHSQSDGGCAGVTMPVTTSVAAGDPAAK